MPSRRGRGRVRGMRQRRFLVPGAAEGVRPGIYHCLSRVVDKRMVLKPLFPALRSGHRLFQRPSPQKQIPRQAEFPESRFGIDRDALVGRLRLVRIGRHEIPGLDGRNEGRAAGGEERHADTVRARGAVAVSAIQSFCRFAVRRKKSLPGIHFRGESSPKTMPSKCERVSSIVRALPPRCARSAGAAQTTRVLSTSFSNPGWSAALSAAPVDGGARTRPANAAMAAWAVRRPHGLRVACIDGLLIPLKSPGPHLGSSQRCQAGARGLMASSKVALRRKSSGRYAGFPGSGLIQAAWCRP